ncbi:plasmid replication, integration and excision activator [Knoellia sp. 3-2P3]|uniref:plasmid replication, integration and excision activator n=1 Tax=unclassified Knoellia TaxID=2618719 RepID=UPI0023DC67EF|nr:plasmid replication, integration and excision activator [Knoellia sp. 3-2P3]MDF2093619.1 plasmid replication, integration and excision activator [Knoellia sp. 3-2P3]
MAIQPRIRVLFEDVFPDGALMRGEVTAVEDFDALQAAKAAGRDPGDVQLRDKVTGLRVWEVRIVDLDENARKGQGEVTVKISADAQPVPPPKPEGQKLRPVEFENLTATAWIDDRGNRPNIAWSYRADAVRAPGSKPASGSGAGQRQSEKGAA